ncbi:MAG: hypothetical protein IJ459_01985 [Clostridia bacterium]|nr:hypothetical protein [Clostridia bacterium]
MNYKNQTAALTVYCRFQEKYETVYIHYVTKDGELYLVSPNGCESSCCGRDECNACLVKSAEVFKRTFRATP